jgi:nucleotide-binding universal stress UspA family protein
MGITEIGGMIQPVRAVVWLVEGTWQGCLDAAAKILPRDAQVALLHVTPSDVGEITEAATTGLLGRASRAHRSTGHFEEVADEEASEILQAAAKRLGRENTELVHRRGRVEREVVSAVADGVDLLVVARDGDRSRLGPHSLGHPTRFIVDHAPCPVLLVWPDEAPGIESIPPPPPGHHPRPNGPHRESP